MNVPRPEPKTPDIENEELSKKKFDAKVEYELDVIKTELKDLYDLKQEDYKEMNGQIDALKGEMANQDVDNKVKIYELKNAAQVTAIDNRMTKLETTYTTGQATQDKDIKALQDQAKEIKKALEPTPKGNLLTRFKFWAFVVPTLAGVTTSVISLVVSFLALNKTPVQDNPPHVDPVLGPDEIKAMEVYVSRFFGQTQKDFWTAISKFITTYNGEVDLTSQTMFMGYVKQQDLPGLRAWTWQVGEQSALMGQAYAAYTQAQHSSQIYLALADMTVTRNNAVTPLPHAVAADICELALFKAILGG